MDIIRNDVIGVVLMPDGLTPVVELPIRVWSAARNRMIYRTKTDENGIFRLPPLRAENCDILAGRVRVSLAMAGMEKGIFYQQHDVIMVLPRAPVTVSSARLAELTTIPAMLQLPAVRSGEGVADVVVPSQVVDDVIVAPDIVLPPEPPEPVSP